jgi:hypothetical protein
MARLTISLRVDPATGKKDIVVKLHSDEDALPHEHEQQHRRLVDKLIEGGLIKADEVGRVVVEREEGSGGGRDGGGRADGAEGGIIGGWRRDDFSGDGTQIARPSEYLQDVPSGHEFDQVVISRFEPVNRFDEL